MDDIQLILYIIFVVGYLIFKALTSGKKKSARREPEQQADHGPMEDTQSKPKPVTFEDILKELAGVEEPKSEPKPELVKEQKQQAKKKADEIPSETSETYKQSVRKAKKIKTIDEQIDLENIKTGVKKVIDLQEEEDTTPASDYLKMLKNPDDARKAIILSEIINRKY